MKKYLFVFTLISFKGFASIPLNRYYVDFAIAGGATKQALLFQGKTIQKTKEKYSFISQINAGRDFQIGQSAFSLGGLIGLRFLGARTPFDLEDSKSQTTFKGKSVFSLPLGLRAGYQYGLYFLYIQGGMALMHFKKDFLQQEKGSVFKISQSIFAGAPWIEAGFQIPVAQRFAAGAFLATCFKKSKLKDHAFSLSYRQFVLGISISYRISAF